MAAQALPLPEEVAGLVRYARSTYRKLSQRELAEATAKIGRPVAESVIQRIENGQPPTIGELVAIAAALGVNIWQLGATEEDYPEIGLLMEAGWDPSKLVERIRCLVKRPSHLRLLSRTMA